MKRFSWLVLPLGLLACAGERDLPPPGGTGGGTGDGGTAVSGLPCDVAQLMQDKCISCHASTPLYGAPMALTSYADLVKIAPSGKSYAALSVDRIKDSTRPMPPGGGVTAAELAALENWVNDGVPEGSCGDVGNPDGGSTTPPLPDLGNVCSSGTHWNGRRNSNMRPGEACIACHSSDEGPIYAGMGTVYPSLHEPDDCNGVSGVEVEFTDKNGNKYTTTSNGAGNILLTYPRSLAKPYTVKLKYEGRERAMITPQTNSDCNSCHTQNGDQNAPGRIVAP